MHLRNIHTESFRLHYFSNELVSLHIFLYKKVECKSNIQTFLALKYILIC